MNNKFYQSNTLKFCIFIGILLICWGLGRIFKISLDDCRKFFYQFPLALSGIIFVILYIVLTTLIWFGPKDVLRIAAAVIFGAHVSTLFVWAGEMGNAYILFYLSRKLGQEYVIQKFRVKSDQLNKTKRDSSFFGALALRVNPLIPFRVIDLGAGLSKISFKKYFSAIVIVSYFRIFWLQYILAGAGENVFKNPMILNDYIKSHPFIIFYSALYFLAVFILSIIALVLRLNRNKS